MTQAERLARREQLRADIAKQEVELEQLRAEESRLLETCEHLYADGRGAATGGRVKIARSAGASSRRATRSSGGSGAGPVVRCAPGSRQFLPAPRRVVL